MRKLRSVWRLRRSLQHRETYKYLGVRDGVPGFQEIPAYVPDMNHTINQIDSKSSCTGKAREGGNMVDVFLYGSSSNVMDFILVGRRSTVQAVLRQIPAKNKLGDSIGHCDSSEDTMAGLLRYMDDVTDAKIIWEAEVYRMTLVGCD
ncbi:uncharacterized protein Z519_04626 [Cladophialophora bantiana CBS 173.52]|uniref:Uncharacterized protein n=1 Tax=Cladophialophora bantiana (strain ATCC 10958 / CBS 173.52 / CDC B-1940 / NIH 8579) TaxID=1442370 RepID=A0A0D2ID14_CLAB1|nr:uncharacterized protein Z519_04626 [Cladophialophora bantiana CBS 173.52]KIW94649.1 hypothetical protein Z519_04626 [Cladophialophora bantiana CBS 173.52]